MYIFKKISYFNRENSKEPISSILKLDINVRVISELYDKNLQQYIKNTEIYPSRMCLMYAYNLLYLNDEKTATEYYKKLEKSVNTYMIKADALLELRIVQDLKNNYENNK